jgi:chemotaxis protein methyltransferase CheR
MLSSSDGLTSLKSQRLFTDMRINSKEIMSRGCRNNNYEWNDLISDVSEKIGMLTGNILAEKQRPMIESRLRRRLLELQIKKPVEYLSYWKKNENVETNQLIGLLTTHFTSFFREFSHFEWIAADIERLVKIAREEGRMNLKIWSTACSRGQEAWSLGMWIDFHLKRIDPQMGWSILGTDIDSKSLSEAENGVYHHKEIETIPRELLETYWSKGSGDILDWYRVKNLLRRNISFSTINLLDLPNSRNDQFDLIMCRNVLIYFDKEKQFQIAQSLLQRLFPSGVLISGMSESLSGYGLPIKGVFPSVYRIADTIQEKREPTFKESKNLPLRVLCIDDSSTVISLLKKALRPPEFEVVGTASNGAEAIEKLKILKPDALTLDLHMPVMDGEKFLKETSIAQELPVIIVSSVERNDDQLINHLLNSGVVDYIEKPSLANLEQISEELAQKLKMACILKNNRKIF